MAKKIMVVDDDPQIRGFGHSFLSGAGCWEQGGQVSVLPVTGRIGPGGDFDTTDPKRFDHTQYASRYAHEGEVGQAGYYRVRLTDYGGIDAEATAKVRAAAERYTFAAGQAEGHVLVNVGQANERHAVIGRCPYAAQAGREIHPVGRDGLERRESLIVLHG